MRTIKYLVLGMINRQPMTGYDITKELEKEWVDFWYADHSQIYPELRRLLKEELVSFEITIQGEKLEKKLYSITEKGRKDLINWILREEEDLIPKDMFKLKVYFSEALSIEEVKNNFNSQLKKHKMKLNSIKNEMEKIGKVDYELTSDFCNYVVMQGAVFREEAYIAWLLWCLAYIDKIN